MNRRSILSIIGISPLALISSKIPANRALTDILIKRWVKSKEYTLAVFDTMPAATIEYSPSQDQLTFVQHFLHLGLINNFYFGILVDTKTYPDFSRLIEADFLIPRPDPINVFQPDFLEKREPEINKGLVLKYLNDTFNYVISCLEQVNDSSLAEGLSKEKPEFLSGHTNLDLILRGESHTAHHRAQAVVYLRSKGIRPPKYTPYNKF
ncbi:DinB family protein [Eudoraea chungangensis]|uniref:DinB family protein n=1 Tax=Eudoraea chungangensis TaxID=1481905 RepID=UPI0023EDC997|nr:DinB family protein [Eudoraea chungangensis]